MTLIHASCVAVNGPGVLIRGPSGSGKSDLALRLIDEGAVLIADDYCELSAVNGRLIATCPAAIAGKLEVRGLGLVSLPFIATCAISLIVELRESAEIDRHPEATTVNFEGLNVPSVIVDPFTASATGKVRVALRALSMENAARSAILKS